MAIDENVVLAYSNAPGRMQNEIRSTLRTKRLFPMMNNIYDFLFPFGSQHDTEPKAIINHHLNQNQRHLIRLPLRKMVRFTNRQASSGRNKLP